MVATTCSLFTILIKDISTVVIVDTVNTNLETSIAGGGSSTAMRIIETVYALALSERASTETRGGAVSIGLAVGDNSWEDTHEVFRALGEGQLGTAPLGNGAVRVGGTFYAATSLDSTTRSTRVGTLVVSGTEVHTELRDGIAVLVDVVGVGRSVEVSAGSSSSEGSAGRAATVIVTVEDLAGGIAIVVGSAINADTRGNIALRLVGLETTILDAVSVGSASLARSVSHAVVSLAVSSASVVIARSVGRIASERIDAKTIGTANGVDGRGSLARRTIVVGAIKAGAAGHATTILHAVRSRCRAIVVAVASTEAQSGTSVAKGFSVVVSAPCVTNLAISISSAIEANSVVHAVSTLGSDTVVIVVAIINTLASGLLTVNLSCLFTTIETRTRTTSGGGVGNDAGLARTALLAVRARRSSSRAREGSSRSVTAIAVSCASERISANSGSTASGLSRITYGIGNSRRTILVSAVRRVQNLSSSRSLTVSASAIRVAVSTIVERYTSTNLSLALISAISVTTALRLAASRLSVADRLIVLISAVAIRRPAAASSNTSSVRVAADVSNCAVNASTRLLAVSTSGTSAVCVNITEGANTVSDITNLLIRGCGSVSATTVGIGCTTDALTVLVTVRQSRSGAWLSTGVASKVVSAEKGVNAKSSGNIASLLVNLLSTIFSGTTVEVAKTGPARTISLTVSTTSTRTSSVGVTVSSGAKTTISIACARTTTNGSKSVADGCPGISSGATRVETNRGSSVVENTGTASAFPILEGTSHDLITNSRGILCAGSFSSPSYLHVKSERGEWSAHANVEELSSRDTDRTRGGR